jgi:membrane-associated PAP2 superfamily phosphatase
MGSFYETESEIFGWFRLVGHFRVLEFLVCFISSLSTVWFRLEGQKSVEKQNHIINFLHHTSKKNLLLLILLIDNDTDIGC